MPDWLFVIEDIAAACDQYCLQVWDVVGNWVAGLATLAAVIVSLRVARRHAPQLSVSAGIRLVIGADSDIENLPKLLSISVTNPGSRPVKIEGVGWRKSPWGRLHALQQIPPQPSGLTLPYTLDTGDRVNFYIDLRDPEISWGARFAKDFLGSRFPWLGVRLLRVQAWTPSGETFYAPIERSLQKYLLEQTQSQAAAEEGG